MFTHISYRKNSHRKLSLLFSRQIYRVNFFVCIFISVELNNVDWQQQKRKFSICLILVLVLLTNLVRLLYMNLRLIFVLLCVIVVFNNFSLYLYLLICKLHFTTFFFLECWQHIIVFRSFLHIFFFLFLFAHLVNLYS